MFFSVAGSSESETMGAFLCAWFCNVNMGNFKNEECHNYKLPGKWGDQELTDGLS